MEKIKGFFSPVNDRLHICDCATCQADWTEVNSGVKKLDYLWTEIPPFNEVSMSTVRSDLSAILKTPFRCCACVSRPKVVLCSEQYFQLLDDIKGWKGITMAKVLEILATRQSEEEHNIPWY